MVQQQQEVQLLPHDRNIKAKCYIQLQAADSAATAAGHIPAAEEVPGHVVGLGPRQSEDSPNPRNRCSIEQARNKLSGAAHAYPQAHWAPVLSETVVFFL